MGEKEHRTFNIEFGVPIISRDSGRNDSVWIMGSGSDKGLRWAGNGAIRGKLAVIADFA